MLLKGSVEGITTSCIFLQNSLQALMLGERYAVMDPQSPQKEMYKVQELIAWNLMIILMRSIAEPTLTCREVEEASPQKSVILIDICTRCSLGIQLPQV